MKFRPKKETSDSQNFRYEALRYLVLKKLRVSHLSHFF